MPCKIKIILNAGCGGRNIESHFDDLALQGKTFRCA